MDDMREIENRMQEMERKKEQVTAPLPVEQKESRAESSAVAENEVSLAAPAVMEAAKASMDEARGLVTDKKKVSKRAKDLANIADDMIENQLDTERLKNEKAASKNKVERAQIANALYEAKQNGIRLRKEAKHQSKMQKERHKAERKKAYWQAHEETLKQYGLREGSSKVACEIIRFLDGVKGFFNGLSKVSDAIIKALKYILIIGGITAVLMIIPVTRNWILNLLGFIK